MPVAIDGERIDERMPVVRQRPAARTPQPPHAPLLIQPGSTRRHSRSSPPAPRILLDIRTVVVRCLPLRTPRTGAEQMLQGLVVFLRLPEQPVPGVEQTVIRNGGQFAEFNSAPGATLRRKAPAIPLLRWCCAPRARPCFDASISPHRAGLARSTKYPPTTPADDAPSRRCHPPFAAASAMDSATFCTPLAKPLRASVRSHNILLMWLPGTKYISTEEGTGFLRFHALLWAEHSRRTLA